MWAWSCRPGRPDTAHCRAVPDQSLTPVLAPGSPAGWASRRRRGPGEERESLLPTAENKTARVRGLGMPCGGRRASRAGSALGGGLKVSEKGPRRATWGVGLTCHPAARRWGAGPQLGLVLPSPILGGLGGRADRGGQELGSQVRSAGAVGAQPGIGLVSSPGKTSKDGGLARPGGASLGIP